MALINRTLIIFKYLWEISDESHTVSLADISAYLKQYDIAADPRTLRKDIEQLVEFGVDIVKDRKVQNPVLQNAHHRCRWKTSGPIRTNSRRTLPKRAGRASLGWGCYLPSNESNCCRILRKVAANAIGYSILRNIERILFKNKKLHRKASGSYVFVWCNIRWY